MKNLFLSLRKPSLLLALGTLFMYSCQPIKYNLRDTTTMSAYKSGIFTKPKVADLVISKDKIKGESSGNLKEKNIESIKNEALQNAIKNSQADILVDPVYEINRNDAIINVSVIGFPAKIVDFRDFTADDTLSFSISNKIHVRSLNLKTDDASNKIGTEEHNALKKKKALKTGLITGAAVAGTALILGIVGATL